MREDNYWRTTCYADGEGSPSRAWGNSKGLYAVGAYGSGKKCGNNSADDLVRIAGLGFRELSPREIEKIRGAVLWAPFKQTNIKLPKKDIGVLFGDI
ncbi:MAG: hypothetical protein WA109_09735 [Bellilinea sp.]